MREGATEGRKDEGREREKGLRRKGLVLKRVDVSHQATSQRGSVRAVTTSFSRKLNRGVS